MINKLKRRLSISDTLQDDLLKDLLDDASDHFKAITGSFSVPRALEFIVIDVAEKRYVRKGSAGLDTESVDGYSVSYQDGKSDFDEYMELLDREYGLSKSQREKGWVMFH